MKTKQHYGFQLAIAAWACDWLSCYTGKLAKVVETLHLSIELRRLLWCKKGWEEKWKGNDVPNVVTVLWLFPPQMCIQPKGTWCLAWEGPHRGKALARRGTLGNRSQLGGCCWWGLLDTVDKVVQLCFRQNYCQVVNSWAEPGFPGGLPSNSKVTCALTENADSALLRPGWDVHLRAAQRRIQAGGRDEAEMTGCTGNGSVPQPADHTGSQPCSFLHFSAQPLDTHLSCSAYNLSFLPGCPLLAISWLLTGLPTKPMRLLSLRCSCKDVKGSRTKHDCNIDGQTLRITSWKGGAFRGWSHDQTTV